MQLMSSVIPKLEQLKKEGESGRRKITQYTRYGTVVLATFQSIGISVALQSQSAGGMSIVTQQGFGFVFTAAVSLVTGTMFLVWLGEQITERGIGNGISLIIFAGIVAGLPAAIGGTLELVRTGEMNALTILVLFALALAVTGFVVFVERGQRRITVNYAKRQQGRKVYAAQSPHLPLKLNMAGVIPPIFASSIILFPATMGSWVGQGEGMGWLKDISATLSPGQPLYVLFYALAIVFFCFFYTALVFNAKETADNLKKSGAFIPGIRPGEQTAKYIDIVMTQGGSANVITNLQTSQGPVNLNVLLTITQNGAVLNTTAPGTAGPYTVAISNVTLDQNICANYPAGGTISFTKSSTGTTGVVTFTSACDGSYGYSEQ